MLKNYLFALFLLVWQIPVNAGDSNTRANTINLANQNWLPFAGEALKEHGILSLITKEAFATQGIKVNYDFIPFESALDLTKKGQIDGMAAWTQLRQWSDELLYSDPIMKHELVIYKRLYANLETTPVSKLFGKSIGVQRGYNYTELLNTLIEKDRIKPVYADGPEESFYHLLTGKVDFCVATQLGGQATLNKNFSPSEIGALAQVPSEFTMVPSYLILSKKKAKSQELLTKLNQGLKTIQENGTYNRLVADFLANKY